MKNQTKTQNMINGLSEPMKLIFNYNNVFYSFYYNDFSGCVHRSREYAINYVYSGEMILDNGKEQIHVGKGECIFIPRDHHITMYKKQKTVNGIAVSSLCLHAVSCARCTVSWNNAECQLTLQSSIPV